MINWPAARCRVLLNTARLLEVTYGCFTKSRSCTEYRCHCGVSYRLTEISELVLERLARRFTGPNMT